MRIEDIKTNAHRPILKKDLDAGDDDCGRIFRARVRVLDRIQVQVQVQVRFR